jgi:hypothetical protein
MKSRIHPINETQTLIDQLRDGITSLPDRRAVENVYQQHGFANRKAYLEDLAQEYDRQTVFTLADLLGPNEDFDGLVTSLEDYADG